MARQLSFVDAAVIDVKEIRFESEFRMYCEQNLCGKYGANYTCPPHCGSAEEMRERVMRHQHALVLRSLHQGVKYSDNAAVRGAQVKHNNDMLTLVKELKNGGFAPLMAGASDCTLCEKCLWDQNTSCSREEDRFSCMSAYCINVADLAQKCGIDYTYNEGVLSLFGMICF
ncbi:MAG: DUF2284 domain-containing protein, partial [Oscillospiraceae bacterium]|nr:DUF2284 domain-containing protein [Oscillospiraceae bacterium]